MKENSEWDFRFLCCDCTEEIIKKYTWEFVLDNFLNYTGEFVLESLGIIEDREILFGQPNYLLNSIARIAIGKQQDNKSD